MEFCRVPLTAPLKLAFYLTAATTATTAQMQTAFQVTSSITSSCTVNAAELDFGAYHGIQDDQTGTGTITVTCTKGISYQIGLDKGLHYRAPDRRLKHRTTAHYLNYELYRDAGRALRWGDDDSSDIHMMSNGTAQTINVYGRVPGGQIGPVGSYSNTTTVTVNF